MTLARRGWDAAPSVRAADALGWALTRSGDAESGYRWSKRALKLGSLDPIWRSHAGLSALAAGRRSEGRKQLRIALAHGLDGYPWQAQRVRRRAEVIRSGGRCAMGSIMSLPTLLNTVRSHGMRVSTARRSVLEALLAAERPLTADEIAGDADLASTYRNLETLESIGIVRHVHLGHGPGRYELTRPRPRLGDLRGLRSLHPAALPGAAGDPPRGARSGRLRARLHALPAGRSLQRLSLHLICPAVNERGLRDAARHLGAQLPHGRTLPEGEWRARHRVLLWLLWAHVAAMPVISLLFDQGPGQAALDCATVGFWAVLAQLKLGGRRTQSVIVTLGLLTSSALIVHVSDGLPESYFHFFVMVAALSLYEDWVPFGAAVAFVLIQQGITAAIVDYDRAESPWLWALIHSAFIGALSVVLLVTWRASERNREAFRSLVESLEEGVLMVDETGAWSRPTRARGASSAWIPPACSRPPAPTPTGLRRRGRRAAGRGGPARCG